MARTREEMLELGCSLAYNYAFRVIDDTCKPADGGIDTYIISRGGTPEPLPETVTEAIEYLTWRGLAMYSEEKNLGLITIQDEDEPIFFCVECRKPAIGSCENCDAHICEEHEAGLHDDVHTCRNTQTCADRIVAANSEVRP